ncbi:nucleotidyltransferase domain-containing protein, partial [Arthrospira platensis SPKY1]|nr:nucleotidyltransferase domain-containing protein [Arthrospira platensis SPKY1]
MIKMSNTLQNIDDDTLVAISKFKEIVTKKYDVQSFVLFGSRARGDHLVSSDIDLLVVFDDDLVNRVDV